MDRTTAARARISEVKRELASEKIELPCIQCRHWALACNHPAVATISVNPVNGKVTSTPADAAKQRLETGLCGPEGSLFDSRSAFGSAVITLFNTEAGRWSLAIIAFGLWAAFN